MGGGRDLEKSFLILHALTDIFLDDLELKLINVQFYISHLYTLYCALLPVQYYQYICIVGKLWKVSLLFTYIPPYRISYSNFINCNSDFHWLAKVFFLTNQLTQPKNLSSNIVYDPFSCRSQDDVRPTVSFPMMLQMNYLFSGNIPIFKPDYDLC